MITIRPVEVEEAGLLADLSRKTFYDSFSPDNTEENMRLFLEKQFSRDALIKEVGRPGNHFFIAREGETPVGYVKMREHPADSPDCIRLTPAVEISRFYAVNEFIGKGIGRLMMQHALEFAAGLGAKCVWLGVWEKNERAIRFYRKWMFEKVGTHPFLLGNDLQTDWIMARSII
jgi:ribosomal protein S18 acetylase RimI-like enzyme